MKELTSEEWFSCIEQKNLIRVRQLAVHIREAKKKNKLRKDKKKKNIVTEFGHYNEQGDAAIHMAIRLGYLDIVALLLVNGANIEQRNSSHHTPLMVALLELQLTIATFLIQRGANPFLSDGDGYSILHLAVKTANKDIVKSALTWEMTLNAKDVQNRTPLHHASLSGNFEIVKMLVEAGVNILEKDLCGSKALHLASNKEVKEYLEEKEKELKEKRTSFSEETSADEPEVQQESAKIYDSSKITVGHPNLESDNYYAILGVDETFDSGSLKKAFFKLAIHYHPDKNPDADQNIFKKIHEAYTILSDSVLREAYNRHGLAGLEEVKARRQNVQPAWSKEELYDFMEERMKGFESANRKFSYIDEVLEKINALSGLTQSGETAEEEEEEDNYYHQFFDTSLDEASHPQQHRSSIPSKTSSVSEKTKEDQLPSKNALDLFKDFDDNFDL